MLPNVIFLSTRVVTRETKWINGKDYWVYRVGEAIYTPVCTNDGFTHINSIWVHHYSQKFTILMLSHEITHWLIAKLFGNLESYWCMGYRLNEIYDNVYNYILKCTRLWDVT